MSRKLPTLTPLTNAQLIIAGMETQQVQQVRDYCTVLIHSRAPKATRTKAPKATGSAVLP